MSESITSGEFQKKFGRYRQKAVTAPVFISLYGKTSLVFMSKDHYDDLLDRLNPAIPGADALQDANVPSGEASLQNEADEVDVSESDLGELRSLMDGASG